MTERFHSGTCTNLSQHGDKMWLSPDSVKGHWHAVLLGKECCGTNTSRVCMDGNHLVCEGRLGKNPRCSCPCHEVRGALRL